jgi:hypothetical protein
MCVVAAENLKFAVLDPPCQPKPAGKIFETVTSAVTANRLARPPFGAGSSTTTFSTFGGVSDLGSSARNAGAEAWNEPTCACR